MDVELIMLSCTPFALEFITQNMFLIIKTYLQIMQSLNRTCQTGINVRKGGGLSQTYIGVTAQ